MPALRGHEEKLMVELCVLRPKYPQQLARESKGHGD